MNNGGGETTNVSLSLELDVGVDRLQDVGEGGFVDKEERGVVQVFLEEDPTESNGREVEEVNLRSERGQRTTREERKRVVRTILILLN
jgi:hypothetical protein